jgi:hypothetical protein
MSFFKITGRLLSLPAALVVAPVSAVFKGIATLHEGGTIDDALKNAGKEFCETGDSIVDAGGDLGEEYLPKIAPVVIAVGAAVLTEKSAEKKKESKFLDEPLSYSEKNNLRFTNHVFNKKKLI